MGQMQSKAQAMIEFIGSTVQEVGQNAKNAPAEVRMAGVIVAATILGFYVIPAFLRRRALSKLRQQKQDERRQNMMKLKQKLEHQAELSQEKRDAIVNLSLQELIEKLQNGTLSAVHVLEAYRAKALAVHEKINCLVEPIWEAEIWAMEADSMTGPKPPLHGVPVSLKDQFGVKGYDSTLGCAKFINQPYADDSNLVKMLRAAGAIPFVKTTTPQTMISTEATSPLFGMTKNPRNLNRGPGGSSSGEGALIAGGGSILGIGTDLGGSIRIPSSSCGVYGFKPTSQRGSHHGMRSPCGEGQQCIPESVGPLARDVHGLVVGTRAILSPQLFELDRYVVPVPFREEKYNEMKGKKLKFGYYVDNGYFTAVPPMVRGVKDTIAALEKEGHEVEVWDISPHINDIMVRFVKVLFGVGGKQLNRMVKDDAIDEAMRLMLFMLNVKVWIKKLIAKMIKPFMPAMAIMAANMGGVDSVLGWWDHIEEVCELRRKIVAEWESKGFDAVISPGLGIPAMPLYEAKKVTGAISYTAIYNLLNFPAGSMPVGTIRKEDTEAPYPVKDLWHRAAKNALKGSEGLPINVQVVTLPYEDEKCLQIIETVDKAVKKHLS